MLVLAYSEQQRGVSKHWRIEATGCAADAMADARAEIRALVADRDALEHRISETSERLRSRGVTEHTPLIDSEARCLPPAHATALQL